MKLIFADGSKLYKPFRHPLIGIKLNNQRPCDIEISYKEILDWLDSTDYNDENLFSYLKDYMIHCLFACQEIK